MWYEKRKKGYAFRERYKDPVSGEIRNVCVTMPDKSKSSKEIARRLLADRIRKELSALMLPTDLTFKKLCDFYIEWERENLKKQTAMSTEQKLNIICKLIGPALHVSDLNAWYVKEKLKAEKACTYNERLKIFKAMMRWAYANDFIEDVSFIAKLQRRKDDPVRIKDKDKYLEHDEINKVLAAACHKYELLTRFLLLSGLRIGEAIALDAKDVNVRTRTINVERSFSLVTREISSTKTDASCRQVFIQDELLKCIKEINAYRADLCRKKGRIIPSFFPDVRSDRISYDAYRIYLRKLSLKTIGRTITPHALRHTHTALLAEAGIPLQDISHRLGHSDSDVTKNVYMHVNNRLKEKENERLKAVSLL